MATQRKREEKGREVGREEEGGAVKRKSWGLGVVEVFSRLEGLSPQRRRHCVEWVKGSNTPPTGFSDNSRPQCSLLSEEEEKKRKKELVKRSSAMHQVGSDGGFSEGCWGFVRHVASFVSRCLETGPLAEESPM